MFQHGRGLCFFEPLSPPPLAGRGGGGRSLLNQYPPPQPSPARGEGGWNRLSAVGRHDRKAPADCSGVMFAASAMRPKRAGSSSRLLQVKM